MNDDVLEHCPELSKAIMENAKLKYRIQILQAVGRNVLKSVVLLKRPFCACYEKGNFVTYFLFQDILSLLIENVRFHL